MTEHTVRIENFGRIQRILSRICEANLSVLLRAHNDPSIAVRGRASSVINEGQVGFRIANLSAAGMEHLKSASAIRVEFKGMSTQVAFDARFVRSEDAAIVVTQPKVIFSTERRQTSRFQTTSEHSAFLELSLMKDGAFDRNLATPHFAYTPDISSLCRIHDVSEGGLCVLSRFPAILSSVNRGQIDEKAQLCLPMLAPIHISVEARWIKRIKERSGDVDGRFARRALIGFEFKNPTDDLILRIRQFVRAMNLSQAI